METFLDRNFCQGEKLITQMETPSQETSGVSAPNTNLAVAASASRPVRRKRTARDAAIGPTQKEKTSPLSCGEPSAKRRHHDLSEKCSAKAQDLSSCNFLKNLWKITESNHFQSIWWGDDGDFIVIEEPFFRTEVLARTGRLKIFDIDSMKSFVRHLHHHGFYITEGDSPSSASCAGFLAEGAAISSPCEVRSSSTCEIALGIVELVASQSKVRWLTAGDIWVLIFLKILHSSVARKWQKCKQGWLLPGLL